MSAEFIPTTLLLPETTYELVFWRVHDLDGDPLGYNRPVTFTTAAAATVGTLIVTSATTAAASSDLDPDGYGVSIDGQPAQPIGVNGTVTIANLAAGAHTARLSGVSENSIRPLMMDPTFADLQRDPRFNQLLRRMKLRN